MLDRLLPAAWRKGLVAAEWFPAPAQTALLTLPPIAGGIDGSVVLLARDGAYRRLHVQELGSEPLSLAFAGLGDGAGLGMIVTTGPDAWAAPARWQVRWTWHWLRRRSPIAVPCGAAVPNAADVRVPTGPVTAMHRIEPPPPAPEPVPEPVEPPVLLAIERFWRANGGAYVSGWVHAYAASVHSARFVQDEGPEVMIEAPQPRPDLVPHFAMLPADARPGFSLHLPHQAGSSLHLVVETDDGPLDATATLPAMEPDGAFAWEDPAALSAREGAAWSLFHAAADQAGRDVLEVGARVVAMSSVEMRGTFPNAASYLGLDIHPGPGVDIVGDVHRLSQLVGEARFDAVFSSAVLEHLAMPWLAAVEMNRALRPGGLVFHRTHQCWPVHEQPNDFYRFSDEALRVLFGPLHGFEPIDAGMALPVTMHVRDRSWAFGHVMPLNPAYGMSWVLARKVAECTSAPPGPAETLSRRYPIGAGQ